MHKLGPNSLIDYKGAFFKIFAAKSRQVRPTGQSFLPRLDLPVHYVHNDAGGSYQTH